MARISTLDRVMESLVLSLSPFNRRRPLTQQRKREQGLRLLREEITTINEIIILTESCDITPDEILANGRRFNNQSVIDWALSHGATSIV